MADEPRGIPEVPEASEAIDAEGGPSVRVTSLGRATAIMASGTLVSRALGFVRTALLAAAVGGIAFGANAYDVANRIPNALYAVLAAGVFNAVLVPQIVKAFHRPDGKRTVDRIVTIILALSLGVTALFTIAAPIVVRLYSDSTWTAAQRDLATAFAFLVIPQLFFYAAYTILGEVLNAREQFGPYMWAPALNNVIGIAGLTAYLVVFGSYTPENDGPGTWSTARILWLAVPATLAMAAQAGILLWPLIKGGYRPAFVLRGPKGELATVRTVAGWALAAVIIEQVGLLLAVRVASAANPEGVDPTIPGNAAYTLALTLYLVPHSLVTVSLLTALNTSMAKNWTRGDAEGTRVDVARGMRLTAAFTFYATAALIVLAPMLARTAFPTLSVPVVHSIALVLIALSLGMVPLGAMVLVKRALFVLEDAKGIFLIHIPMTITLVGVAYLGKFTLDEKWWTVVMALGLSLSNLVGLVLRSGGLKRRLGSLGGRGVGRVHWFAAVAAVVAAGAGYALRLVLPDVADVSTNDTIARVVEGGAICLAIGLIMGLVYVAVMKVLRVEEVNAVVGSVTRRLRRNVR
ncbi:MAG: murein biosynthesis protein MurJ [Demequina sp.]|nr:murein biosynthesis protein MurJ [Demequina sp.]